MGERLEKTLHETTNYTEKDYKQDLQENKNTFEDVQLDLGLTYFSLKPMGERLEKTLHETTNYTEKDYKQDLQENKNTFEDVQLDL